MKKLVLNKIDCNTALVLAEPHYLQVIKKATNKTLVISRKALFAAFLLTFINLFV